MVRATGAFPTHPVNTNEIALNSKKRDLITGVMFFIVATTHLPRNPTCLDFQVHVIALTGYTSSLLPERDNAEPLAKFPLNFRFCVTQSSIVRPHAESLP